MYKLHLKPTIHNLPMIEHFFTLRKKQTKKLKVKRWDASLPEAFCLCHSRRETRKEYQNQTKK
jgi:hypothetical protein